MRRIKLYEQFVNEKFADKYPKNSWVDIVATKEEFADVIEDLIKIAYKNIPGGSLEDPKRIIADPAVDYWNANDVDEDPDADAVIFGKHTSYGIKLIGMGQDGTRPGKFESIRKLQQDLSKEGCFTEISDNVLNLLRKDIPYVNNKEDVERIIGKKIEWIGSRPGLDKDGWYYREIHGHKKLKLLVGHPKGLQKNALSEEE